MDEESLLPFDLPTIARKRVSAAFDGEPLKPGILELNERFMSVMT